MDRSRTLPAAGELETSNLFSTFSGPRWSKRHWESATNRRTPVEESWFQSVFAGGESSEPWASAPFDEDSDWQFNSASEERISDLVAMYEAACEESRRVVALAASLDDMSAKDTRHGRVSLRWILLHMIEETARHAGHADLIRERIDGSTGI